MSDKKFWNNRYRENEIPWDTGSPDSILVRTIDDFPINPGKALELGCGTGTNSLWLAEKGFHVTGLDISELAIETAVKKSSGASKPARFLCMDFLKEPMEEGEFSFVFDRGFFHSLGSARAQSRAASRIRDVLGKGGLWLSIIGSCDSPPRETGPPMLSARDIVKTVEPYFMILELSAEKMDSKRPEPPPAWKCIMRRREL